MDALSPFCSKLVTLTPRGGLWTFLANLALCAPRRAGWFGFGLSLSRQIWISITVMRYQKKNNCKSPNFTALKTMIYIFYKKTHYHKKNNNKVFKFLPQKSHNKYQKSRLTLNRLSIWKKNVRKQWWEKANRPVLQSSR